MKEKFIRKLEALMKEKFIQELEALEPIYNNIIMENVYKLDKITQSLKYYSNLADKLEKDNLEYSYCLNLINELIQLGVKTKDFILKKEAMKSQLLTCIDMLKKGEDVEVVANKLCNGKLLS